MKVKYKIDENRNLDKIDKKVIVNMVKILKKYVLIDKTGLVEYDNYKKTVT